MSGVLRFKVGVTLDPPTPALGRLLGSCDMAARILEHDVTITCGREGHGPTDPHTLGRAVDIRTRDLSDEQTLNLFQFLKKHLGPSFYVQYESVGLPSEILKPIAVANAGASANHIHAQIAKSIPEWPQPTDEHLIV